jgi:hypothetical protein
MLRHTYITTMLDAGAGLRDVQIAARHADPRTTMRYDRAATTSTATSTTSWPPTWRLAHDPACVSRGRARGRRPTLPNSGRRPDACLCTGRDIYSRFVGSHVFLSVTAQSFPFFW